MEASWLCSLQSSSTQMAQGAISRAILAKKDPRNSCQEGSSGQAVIGETAPVSPTIG